MTVRMTARGVCHLPALLPVSGLLGFVGFDAADVVWSTFHQCAHQIIGLFLKGRRKSKRDNDETDDHNDESLTDCWRTLQQQGHTLSFQRPFPRDKEEGQVHTEHTHLYFAACSCGSTLLFSVEVFWKQCSDEGAVWGQRWGVRTDTERLVSSSYINKRKLLSFPGSQKTKKCS